MDDALMIFKKRKCRKGQSGSSAATLVAVLGLLIVLYILFLPPDIREDLLGENDTETAESGTFITNLIKENPGRLEEIDKLEVEHNLPSINLFSLSEGKVLKKVSTLYVKNGIFDRKDERVSFGVFDLENTNNAQLSFISKEGRGRLIIKLNGHEVYNNEVAGRNVGPIELSKEFLSDSNDLEFSVSDGGFAFWSTNEYDLENIQITADVTDKTASESRNTFVISTTEKFNLDKARLRFYPDCRIGEVGVLEVYVNNHQIFSSVPDCGVLRPIEFSPAYLESGENKVVFQTTRGSYLIDNIELRTELKEVTFPAYYFDIDKDEFADILDNKHDVNMSMRFIDNQELKRGKIFINGKTLSLNTRDAEFSRNIDAFVEEDQNGIRVEPDNTVLDIIELRVDIVKH